MGNVRYFTVIHTFHPIFVNSNHFWWGTDWIDFMKSNFLQSSFIVYDDEFRILNSLWYLTLFCFIPTLLKVATNKLRDIARKVSGVIIVTFYCNHTSGFGEDVLYSPLQMNLWKRCWCWHLSLVLSSLLKSTESSRAYNVERTPIVSFDYCHCRSIALLCRHHVTWTLLFQIHYTILLQFPKCYC